jgi:transmembrane sensor
MNSIEATIADAAADWRLRQDELDAAGWRAFADWLEADPRHAAAMARLDAGEAALPPISRAMPAPPPAARGWGGRARAAGLGLSAMAAALLGTMVVRPGEAPLTVVSTAPGELRTVTLPDGSRVAMNGGTRIEWREAGSVSLAEGQALFTVAPGSSGRFRVEAGGTTITDIGTTFEVTTDRGRLGVAVASGAVRVARGNGAVPLAAGQRLRLAGTGPAVVDRVSPASVAGWRTLRPVFVSEPLESVAAAVGRRIGASIAVPAGLRDRPFSGTVTLTGQAARDVPYLASLIGVEATGGGTAWELVERGRSR